MKSLLSNIIEFLNLTIKANLPFEKLYGLTELEKDRYIHYIGDGQSEYVTNFDSVSGTIFWHVYEKTRYSQPQIQACAKDIQVTYPVRLIANIKRSLLECDSASSAEYLTLNLINILANQTNTLRKALGAKQILFEALASDDNVKGVKSHKDYITVAIDFKLVIIGTNECLNQNACINFTNIPVIVEKVYCPTVQVDGENIPNQKLVNLISGENISITIGINGEIIISSTSSGDVISVNGQTGVVVLDANDVGAYPDTNPSGFITAAQAPIQSVTGLDTDNSNPAFPIIQIAVDGVTITGDGTAGNPLVGASSFALEILEDGVSVDANVDEINFKTPLKATQTAAGKVDVDFVDVNAFKLLGNNTNALASVQEIDLDNSLRFDPLSGNLGINPTPTVYPPYIVGAVLRIFYGT
jgi:hypothetical protein